MIDEIKVPPADSESNEEAAWFFKQQVETLTGQLANARAEVVKVMSERDFLRTIVSRQAAALENWSEK